ncbi:MAG: TIGR02391 family protein [Planctomycetes bacterium]|nr:TIGR02391 family protein [Planctomycetota bacterium]
MNIQVIAVEAGDLLKGSTTVNEIERIGKAVFPFAREAFSNASITSSRAQAIYEWIMSLGKHDTSGDNRVRLLKEFLFRLGTDDQHSSLVQIMGQAGIGNDSPDVGRLNQFDSRRFHREIAIHSRKLFGQGHYFHAVFESAKIYNKQVREKSKSTKDGADLMLSVWNHDNGVLKVTPCISETDKSVQDGIRFLSSGLMRAIRNPTAHEPALHWPICEQDALDILSFVSFLFRQLDNSVFIQQ